MRAAAGVEGLTWPDVRRTGVVRFGQTVDNDVMKVAARVGMTHLDNVRGLLNVNPAAAAQEISSPAFKNSSKSSSASRPVGTATGTRMEMGRNASVARSLSPQTVLLEMSMLLSIVF